jgi:hypothetical protein
MTGMSLRTEGLVTKGTVVDDRKMGFSGSLIVSCGLGSILGTSDRYVDSKSELFASIGLV